MKRLTAFVLACLMMLSLLAGCGSKQTTPPDPNEPQTLPPTTQNKLSATENPLVKDQNTIIISLASDLESLNPITTSTIVTNRLASTSTRTDTMHAAVHGRR